MPSRWPALPALLALPLLTAAVTLDCTHLRADGTSFDLRALGGPHSVHRIQDTPPSITNTTFTVDICQPIKRTKGAPKREECPSGTRVCGIERIIEGGTSIVREAIPIAGDYETSQGRSLDPKITRLKNGASNSDAEQEGVRIELHGGRYPLDKSSGLQQKAIVEFLCDPDLTGNEGFEESREEDEEAAERRRSRRRDDGDGDDGDEKDPDDEPADPDAGKSLKLISYKDEGQDDSPLMTLRLSWKTKYACEGATDHPSTPPRKRGWGFFTWFIIVLFLLIASYIIFGSWLNYNRYGARGWDLLPHGDTIRELPYLIQDWGRSCIGMVKGGGSRGGYSAV